MTVDNSLGVPDLADVELLGSGGFSVVYAATHTLFDRRVAVKILTSVTTDDDRRRFEQECRAMGRLSGNPNVVTVYQADYTTSGRPYLIMELVDGGSLADLVIGEGRLRWERAVDLVLPICGAVADAHAQGILHRDIKPDNILLDHDVPKLADFGIARLHDSRAGTSTQVSASWFHTPPETFNHTRDERSDLYSLASTLYTAVAGHPPMWREGDESVYPVIQRLMSEDPPPLPHGSGPPELSDLLQRALARDPDQRPASVAELAGELAALRGAGSPAAGPSRPPIERPPAGRALPPVERPPVERPPLEQRDGTDPLGATTTLHLPATTGQVPAVVRGGTQVMDQQAFEVARAAYAASGPGDPGGTAATTIPPSGHTRRTTALFALAVCLLAATSAAVTWLVLDQTGESAAPAADGASDGGGGATGQVGATTSTTIASTTTLPDGDGDGTPDAEDACPTEAGLVSTGGCPDADGDAVPDAEDACPIDAGLAADGGCPLSTVTIDLVRFHVVSDCDSGLFDGDGDFSLQAFVVHNGTGVEEEVLRAEESRALGDDSEVVIAQTISIVIADQPGKEFRVELRSEENDDNIFDQVLDGRLGPDGQGSATGSHQWVPPSGWSNLNETGDYTLVTGGEGCEVDLDYRVTIT